MLGLSIEAVLLGLMFFTSRAPPPVSETAMAVMITTFPRFRDPPPPERPEPTPQDERDDEREDEREDDTAPPRIPPLNALPSPGQAARPGQDEGEARTAGGEGATEPRRLNLGCLGRSYELMTPQERRDCENQVARTSGIPGRGDTGGPPLTEVQAGFQADGLRKDARNRPVYPSGNRSSIGCPEGTRTACVDGIMNEVFGIRF